LSWIAIALVVVGVYLFIKIAVFAFRMAILVAIVMLLYWIAAPFFGWPQIDFSTPESVTDWRP